jgi:hypothetical protein
LTDSIDLGAKLARPGEGAGSRLHVLRGRALISTRAESIQAVLLNNRGWRDIIEI